MLQLIGNPRDKKLWVLSKVTESRVEVITNLELIPSSLSNKFSIVAGLVQDMDNVDGFSDWFEKLIKKYIEDGYNAEILLNSIDQMIEYVNAYVESKNIDFTRFSKTDKCSRTSVMFLAEDIKAIALSSTCLKLYAVFCYDVNMKLPENMHRIVYEKMVNECVSIGTTTKMFQLIRSRIYRSSITDRYMWDLIKLMISQTPETYVMTVFNFLMVNMLSTLSIERNPIPFLVSIIDDSIGWMMRTVYKDRILYSDSFGGSDDIYGASLSKESFYVYCCNDTIGKAAKVGLELVEQHYKLDKNQFDAVRDRLDKIDCLTPPMKLLTLPIASKVLEVPYKYLLTCPPKHAVLIGLLLNVLAVGVLDEQFPIISEFLISAPKDPSYLSTRSSYRIRNLEFIINDETSIFGFNSKRIKFEIMSSICGVLSASKKNLVSILDGRNLHKISYLNFEHDIIQFFTLLYSNQLENKFQIMTQKSEVYF